MVSCSFRSLLLSAIVLGSCLTWTSARHHYTHSINGHRSRHRRQGAGLYLPTSYIIPGGEGGGAWGEWGDVSPCSRTCGGGVGSQKRICLEVGQDGRPKCSGGDTKYFSCQTQDCPDSSDFRAQQCSEHDDKSFRGVKYKWVPYTKAPNQCELNCMPQGERFYYRHSAKVVDGTRCNDESFDVCVDGQCQPVGCDLMLGSHAREDKCRECRGNGTNCNTYSSLIDSQDFRNGYNDVLLIPRDATNILISEVRASNNYLALRGRDTGKYYLNGDYHIDFPRSLEIAGAVWKYERSQQGFAAPDILRCLGPINEDLYLSLLQQEPNVGIQYEYSLPSSRRPPPSTQYSWAFDEFSACSASCGGGTQTRNVSCHDSDTLEPADESLCDTALRPPTSQQCNTSPCAPHWVEGAWSPCSKPCGEGGTRSRQVHCEKVVNNGYPAVVNDKECFDTLGPKPELFQECGKDAACPSWFTGPWKPCDKLCGPGKQTRQVVCHQKINGRVQVFDDQQCTEEKPSAEQSCELHPCEGVDWVASDWGGCDTCLSKVRTRIVRCSTKGNAVVDDRFCAEHEKPVAEEECDPTKLPACTVQWYATQWSNCSVECGKGIQSRRVFCGLFDGSVVRSVEDARCENETKYPDMKPCEMPEDKCPAKWFAGPWSECTKKCGGGEQFRHVACLLNNETSHNCDGTAVLDSTRSCNLHECDEDQTLPLDAKTTPIMDEDYDEECEEEEEEASTAEEDELTGTTPEDMMLSDSPSTFEGSGTGSTVSDTDTSETGSGEITFSTLEEGSGSESTSESGSTETTESTASGETTETGSSSGSTETEETGSTETSESTVSGSTEESTSEGSTESTSEGSTEVSASSSQTETSSSSTEESTTSSATSESGSTETGTTDESTTETATTESTETTETATTESTETTETATTESTETTETATTESTETTETGSTETTEETGSTETTEETGSTETTEETGSTETTEETGSTETTEETGSTETTESGGSTTESGTTETGSTETSVSGSTETTESGATEETSESSSSESTASEVSTTEGSTVSGSTEETGSTETTESGATETSGSTETTETGSTESTSEGSTEFSSTEDSTTEESTPWDWSTTFSVTRKQCKPRKKPACSKAKFGCCADKRTAAAGPFEEGCPVPATCKESKHGCCPDGVSAAWGPKDKGCPTTPCNETLYGCCKSDNKTAAQGNDQEGCPPPPPPCKSSKFGCCKDGKTEAKGPKKQGCPETQKPKGCASTKFGCCHDNETAAEGPKGKGCPCDTTEFGCCPDGVSAAQGTKLEGCVMSCNGSAFGCCPDGQTPAHGPDYEGCCLAYPYGCCPDNFKPAEGPHLEGCSCQESHYGCCPDNRTIARGPNNQGCGCQYSPHGCCPDRHTDASGPDYEGCGCHTYQFGCCPDGVTIVKGPNLQGCHCRDSQYGCCGDEQTPAQGPNQQGCDCAASKYGCCPDGQTEAKGDKFQGCTDVPENKQAVCALASDRGPCRNYSVYWFYDTEYGGCSRFWYGGCDGNGNRFTSQQECEDVCVQPTPKDACKLPKVKGACTGYNLHWYYDSEREHCGQFVYGGCLGNANNFDSREKCVEQCEPARSDDVCKLPTEAGSCAGNYPRWGYNHETGTCDQFTWGGCEGNGNRFISQAACVQRCNPPGALKPQCSEPQEKGTCSEKLATWSFSGPENRCVPFYYTGCGGNGNRFESEEACSETCPSTHVPDTCTLPAEIGDCANYREKWFYDTAQKRCRQFYYGGCGGNGNNFNSEQECEVRCAEREPVLTTTTVTPQAQPGPGSNQDFCFEDKDPGPCTQFEPRWAYDASLGSCTTFQFGGCGGNRNNFPSEEYCQYYCQGAQDVCQLPMRVGPCTESVTAWFYDASSDVCSQFTYGGCDGNGNRFESREACESRCRTEPPLTTTTTTTIAPTPPHVPSADRCQQPQETGECRGYFIKWYYDYERDACGQFVYGGCGGNDNNFETQEECEGACQQRRPPPPPFTTTTTLGPVEPEECRLPESLEACGENETVFYYNSQNSACEAAPIGACRYANSYRTEEECERQCGVFRGLEVCKYGMDPGPCRGAFPKYYFDPVFNRCDQFMYGGCQGGPNRFSTQEECEQVCNVPPVAPPGTDPACLLTADVGSLECEQQARRRWYYSDIHADCLPLLFTGCGGNGNNFLTKRECQDRCVPPEYETGNEVLQDCDRYVEECASIRCSTSIQRSKTSEGCIKCECVPQEVDCDILARECASLKCTYGVRNTTGEDGCVRCSCIDHPCANRDCPEGQRCVASAYRDPVTQETQYSADCHTVNKEGSCPAEDYNSLDAALSSNCRRECNDDADCRGVGKCCQRGCSQLCLEPPSQTSAPGTTTYAPELPQAPQANSETEPEVTAELGGKATLRCLFHGNPKPKITWKRGEITLDGEAGRYRVLGDGALEIFSLYANDSGVYICVADNGLGISRQEIHLVVNDENVESAAQIADEETAVIGELGQALNIRCLVYGNPLPTVAWYRADGYMVPYSDSRFEARGNTLLIRALQLDTLGEYMCQAYNGVSKPASWTVVVQAYSDDPTMESPYLIPRGGVVMVTPPPPTTPPQLPPRLPEIEPPVYNVPVSTNINWDLGVVNAGSVLSLPCEVDGYPVPEVYWTKDSVRLLSSDRMQITDSRLTINGVTIEDSGVYGCHARNSFSSHESTVQVNVQGMYIPPTCTDNPYFANCQLIVRSKFCRHPYYSGFCCKSCVESGQLDPQDIPLQADMPYKRRK